MNISELSILPNFGYHAEDNGDPTYYIDADENGELCIVDVFNEHDLYKEINLCDITDKMDNNDIQNLNDCYPGLNLPLLKEEDHNRDSYQIDKKYQCIAILYFLKKKLSPSFSDYFISLFEYCQLAEGRLGAGYFYPVSKIMNSLPKKANFITIGETGAYFFDDIDGRISKEYANYCKLTGNFNPNKPANEKFIKKFYVADKYDNDLYLELLVKEKILNREAALLTDKVFNQNAIAALIDGNDRAHQAVPIWAKNGTNGESRIAIFNNNLVYEETSSIEGIDPYNFVFRLKTEFPPDDELGFNMQVTSKYVYIRWQVSRLLDKGLLKKKHLKYMNIENINSIPNNGYNQDIINRIREIKGLPSIDFSKKYYVKDEC